VALQEIGDEVGSVPDTAIDEIVDELLAARRIACYAGAGRASLCGLNTARQAALAPDRCHHRRRHGADAAPADATEPLQAVCSR
jgi:DNA-binding MurR/RpiR family transcriptional regulator